MEGKTKTEDHLAREFLLGFFLVFLGGGFFVCFVGWVFGVLCFLGFLLFFVFFGGVFLWVWVFLVFGVGVCFVWVVRKVRM